MTGNRLVKRTAILIAAAGIAAVLYVLWQRGCFLPGWIQWEERELYDHSRKYEIILQHRSVNIVCNQETIWTSPNDVKVQDVISCDIDGDTEDELVLLCWKTGRYGKDKPFWVKKDEKNWSQHIFVYEYQEKTITPKWMSSFIGPDVVSVSADKNRAPIHRLLLTDREGKISSFVWDSWGFTKEDTEISFAVFGDNLIHEPIYRYGLRNDETFDFLYENVQDIISASDVAVINQETPLVENPSMYSGYPRFGTPVHVGQAIVNAGFDVVTCGTNHALDKGAEGIQTTKDFFTSRNIICLGIQSKEEKEYQPYEILVKNGIKFALLNYTYGTNGIKIPEENPYMVHLLGNEDQIRNDISQAGEEADFVIVFVHWGTENSEQIDDFQKKWAQVFLESKADVVIGTHPHILQPCEIMEDNDGHKMLIYYSIGNYISAQGEETCTKGGIANFTVSLTPSGYEVTEYDLLPLVIKWESGGKYITFPL
ncbi:MAG: CapA family protein [Suilimivivens sp.]